MSCDRKKELHLPISMSLKCLLSIPRVPLSSRYLITAKSMSSSAFVLPYDHQTSGAVVDGVDAAKLWSTTPQGEKPPKAGTTRTFYNIPPSKLTTVSSLGGGFATKKAEEKRELVRKSVGSAVKDLKDLEGVKDVAIDASADPHAAGMLMVILYCWLYC